MGLWGGGGQVGDSTIVVSFILGEGVVTEYGPCLTRRHELVIPGRECWDPSPHLLNSHRFIIRRKKIK